MSKSRRDLSLVAIVALVAGSFAAAAPAQAAGELKIQPSSGAVSAVPHKDDISFTVSATGGNDSRELEDLHFRVTTDGTTDVLAVVADADSGSVVRIIDSSADEEAGVVTSASAFDYSSGDRTSTITLAVQKDGSAYDGTASTVRVTVTAFVDKDGDNLPDSDEWQVAEEVSFIDWDDVTFTNVLTQPVLADQTLVATISDANINLDQSTLGIDLTQNSVTSTVESNSVLRTYSAVRDDLKVSRAVTVNAGTYSSAVYAYTAGSTSTSNRLVAASSRAVDSTTVSTVSATALRTDASEVITDSTSSANIKAGNGSLDYVVFVATSAGAGIEDKTVSLKINEEDNTSLAGATVTVGSSSVTNTDNTDEEEMTVTAVTGADGKATFTVSWTGMNGAPSADSFQMTASVDGVAEAELTLTAAAESPNTIYSADVRANDEELMTATGSQFTLTYHVLNQFGALYGGSDASVEVTDEAGNLYTSTVSNGVATVGMPAYDADNDGDLDMSADVKTTGGDPSVSAFVHDVLVGTDDAVSAVTVTGSFGTATSRLSTNSEATTRADVRFGEYTTTPDSDIDVTATITNSFGNSTRSQVTFSGTNLMFEVDVPNSQKVFEKGSITVWTDQNGVADIDVSSQAGGNQVLTVTAGGVTTTKTIYFGSVAATAGSSLVVTAPAYAAPGSTFQVSGLLTDAFGNAVDTGANALSITYDGPGIAFGTLPTQTDANGKFSFAVLLGQNDTGTATITAAYDQAGDGDFTGTLAPDLDVVVVETVTVGDAPAAQKVNAGSFKGYVAVYAKGYEGQRLSAKIGNDWVIVPSLASGFERVVDFTGAGVDIAVRIYIDRVLIDTINLTTK